MAIGKTQIINILKNNRLEIKVNYMNLMTLENISKSYSEKKLLENISLGINEGEKNRTYWCKWYW